MVTGEGGGWQRWVTGCQAHPEGAGRIWHRAPIRLAEGTGIFSTQPAQEQPVFCAQAGGCWLSRAIPLHLTSLLFLTPHTPPSGNGTTPPDNPYLSLPSRHRDVQGNGAFSFRHARVYFLLLPLQPEGGTAFPFPTRSPKASRSPSPISCLPEPSPRQTQPHSPFSC